MEIKVKAWLEKLGHADKKLKILVALGLAGILLISLSELTPHTKQQKTDSAATDAAYITQLEEKTAALLSSIEGAGECRVMLTLKYSDEKVFARNASENSGEGSNSHNSEYVLYNGQNGEEPLLVKQVYPQVQGVAIVCEGAGNLAVREAVINTVASLYNLPVSKINVSKLKG